MCILFVSISSQPGPGKFKVILASNRDEKFSRPARPAHVWQHNENIIAGTDMTPGREGGTWLAASALGRIAVLLNYSGVPSDSQKKGRGFLAPEHVVYNQWSKKHLKELKTTAQSYNPYHLVCIDLRDPTCKLRHFANVIENDDSEPSIYEHHDNVYAFSNNPCNKTYKKSVFGQKKLREIVNAEYTVETKDKLVEELLKLLKNEEACYPDDVLDMDDTINPEMRKVLSSIFVRAPNGEYGTRTHTIILVDNDNNLDFYEWTLKPNLDKNNPEWIKSHHKMKLDLFH